MNERIYALIIGAAGMLVAWVGISTLLYLRSFTETAEGVVSARVDKFILIQIAGTPPHDGLDTGSYGEGFPLDEHTEHLKVGDKVEVYHPPGQLDDFRLAHQFSYLKPGVYAGIGVVMVIGAGAMLFMPSRKNRSGE